MSSWSDGYVAEIGYTFGYYRELNPLRVRLALLQAGLLPPEIVTACELGFGQGLSVAMHAGATAVRWYGTDFNPAQAGFAQELAVVSGSGAQLYEQAFVEFCSRGDLPDFDYIGLHGIWSWISDENRSVIIDFIRRKLKTGGVVYISYNSFPGNATFAPVRHLLTEYAERMEGHGAGLANRINSALAFTERLFASNPAYLRANPGIAARLNELKGHGTHYLAHEFFNRDWHPMHYATMAGLLSPTKLSYACSAHYLDYIDELHLDLEQSGLLKDIQDPDFRETVRDFMVNQEFRRDYWVKGARIVTRLEKIEALRRQRLIMISHRPDISLTVQGTRGRATMDATVYDPLLDLLADHQPRTIAEIEQALQHYALPFEQLLQAIIMLAGIGHLEMAQNEEEIREAKRHTDPLNSFLLDKARSRTELHCLASPVTGGGILVNRIEQLFLRAYGTGLRQPAEWVQSVWEILGSQGHHLLKDGQALQTAEENITALTAQAGLFFEKRLAVMQALQIV